MVGYKLIGNIVIPYLKPKGLILLALEGRAR